MPKRIPEQELDAILTVVAAYPEGVPVRTIREGLPYELPPRMLQRRLALLVEQKRLVAEGQRKGRRYCVPATITDKGNRVAVGASSTGAGMATTDYMPISPEAEAIKRIIRAPIGERQPVGYQRAFLDDYRPNVIYYLPVETRQRLLDMGRPPYGERPAGSYARMIYHRLLIDLSWNSSRLEGNTYSLLETDRLLKMGEATEGKDALETRMILRHKAGIDFLVDPAEEISFSRYTIFNLHALIADNVLSDLWLRRFPVSIHGTVYHPLEVPQLIEEYFDKILDTAAAITDPFEQAFFALVHFTYLHGFEDVNKRVARFAANIPLIRGNLCPLSFVDVPERAYIDGVLAIYELNRVELLRDVFVWACERSSARYSAVRQSLGEPDPFRLHYRALIAELVAAVVRTGMDKKAAIALIRQRGTEQVSPTDQARFVEVVETEIMSLHEGNIARYLLRPADYQAWRKGWR